MATGNRSADRPALDPLAILAALGRSDAVGIIPVAGGADAALWRVETEQAAYALRVLRPDQAAQSRTEIEAMTAAAGAGIPVPRLQATGLWHGHPALLLGWCPDQTLAEAMLADPARVPSLGLAFGRTQALMHAVPAPAGLAPSGDAWIDWAQPDDALRRRLRELATGPAKLLHLDYHPLNVLVDGERVTAVIDWANARSGDPRADVARTASILRFAPLPDTLPSGRATALRRALTAAWREGYRQSGAPWRTMAPFYAWAGAVMIRDLSPRLGRADLPWLTATYFERVQRWTAFWRGRAGLHP